MTPENAKHSSHSNNILLTNIQRFSLHDGPGIRTTVFLKGCAIHCPWCSNPENLSHDVQNYIKKDKNGKIEEEGIYGKWYSSDELYVEVIKDKAFYGNCESPSSDGVSVLDSLPGGVTFSGGECMLQMKELKLLLERLNTEGVHTAVETSLFSSIENLAIAIQHIDLFYVDIKIMDDRICRGVLGGNLDLYKKNLQTLLQSGKPIVFRIPVIGGYTDSCENWEKVIELIKSYVSYPNVLKVEILKEHNLGTNKYQSLIDAGSTRVNGGNEIKMPEYKGVSDELMEQYKREIEEELSEIGSKIPVEICKV